MSSYDQLLQATIRHIERLKEAGQRHLSVDLTLLAHLQTSVPKPERPVPRPERRSGRVRAFTERPTTPVTPETREATPPLIQAEALSIEEKESSMAHLTERAFACMKCPNLVRSRKNVVFGVGSLEAKLMFVGEAPGMDEDAQGEPFVGKAGQLLTRIIQTMGLSRESVYIGNVLKCRPDTPGRRYGNRKPTPQEMVTCRPYLMEQIRIIRPQVLVALGATAVEGLMGMSSVAITRYRGEFRDFGGIPLMPTYHPSYVLRNQSLRIKRQIWEDMLQVMTRLDLPISEKQRGYFSGGSS